MAGKQMSYDYLNDKRDLWDAFVAVIKDRPILSNVIGVSGVATNTKHEWLEDVVAPISWAVSATVPYTAGDATLDMVSTTWVKVGDILKFELPTGVRASVLLQVTSIISATQVGVAVYGGTTDVNVDTSSAIRLMGRPKNEATCATADDGYEPTTEYNYTQIFDRTAKVSKTSVEIDKYGIGGAVNYQVERQLMDLAYEMVNTSIDMPRVERTASVAGTMWGRFWFMQQATGNSVDALGATITEDMINDALEIASQNGGTGITTFVCNPLQARRISAFNTSGNNPVITQDSRVAGSFVTTFLSDQGVAVTIVADRNFDKDKVAMIDPSKINLVPMKNRAFSDEDAAPVGCDYYARRILGEYTLEMKNAGESHVYIKNLAV